MRRAATLGLVGLALGGPRVYAAGPVDEPMLNAAGRRDAAPGDIGRALRVMAAAAVEHAALVVILALTLS